MFLENIKNIVDTFNGYYGSGKYFVLLLIALIYLFMVEKEKDKKAFFIWYPCLTLFIILNPLFNKIVDPLLNDKVYNRLYWIIPIGIIIAYAAVKIVKSNSEKYGKIIVFIAISTIIIFSGNFIYTKANYIRTDNLYKIPDEYVEVANILRKIEMESEKKAMVSTNLVPYIRLIAPSVRMAYPRMSSGYKDYPIVGFYEAGDVKVLTNLCKEKDVNIIVYDRNILLTISPTYFGYEYYTSTTNYDIYVLK